MRSKKVSMSFVLWACLVAAISAQTITVTAPNGGERWFIGDAVSITWSCSDVIGSMRILLMRSDGTTVGTIASATAADASSYTWTAGALTSGWAAAGEDYVVRVRAVGSETFDASDAAFTLVARPPNVRMESMREIGWTYTFVPATFTAGDTVTILYHLRNDSAYAAGPFHVGLRVGGTIVDRHAFSELVSGSENHGEFAWTATCGQPVAVVADCDGEVAESNEGDNVMTDPELACTQPNLMFFRPLACSSGPGLKAGMNYRFSATIHSDLVRTRSVRVAGGVVGGAVLFDQTYAELAGDESQDVSFIWEVPEGSQRVYFQVDPDNAIAESNEGDNRSELSVTATASTPATESYDLSIRIDRAKSSGPRLGNIQGTVGTAVSIYGEVRGATGAIRDFKVTGWVKSEGRLNSKVFEKDYNDPGMMVIPFRFSWVPEAAGEYQITVKADLGPHAVTVGVVDRVPANNTALVRVNVAKAKTTTVKKR